MLTEHRLQVAPSTYYDHLGKAPTAREQRDGYLLGEVRRVHADNYGHGARNVWLQLNREGIEVARCTVERLMKADGPTGAVRAVLGVSGRAMAENLADHLRTGEELQASDLQI